MGAVFDFGNDLRYHVTQCLSPSIEDFGLRDAVFEAKNIEKKDGKRHPDIFLIVDKTKKHQAFTVGQKRDNSKMDIQVASKNMNGYHCNIAYDIDHGWTINEQGKDKVSTKGTFIYVKNYKQLMSNEPSSSVPISNSQEFRIGLRNSDYNVLFQMRYQGDQKKGNCCDSVKSSRSQRMTWTPKLSTNKNN